MQSYVGRILSCVGRRRMEWKNLAWICKSGQSLVEVKFMGSGDEKRVVQGKIGESLLELARRTDIDLEGACEGSLACSTCHVVLDKKSYLKLKEPSEEENDMLDYAYGLTETSRLGCQVRLDPSLSGMEVHIPSITRNMAVDGYKPKHH